MLTPPASEPPFTGDDSSVWIVDNEPATSEPAKVAPPPASPQPASLAPGRVRAVELAFSPDGRRLAAACGGQMVSGRRQAASQTAAILVSYLVFG